MLKIRIDKLISDAAPFSRKEVHSLVRAGRVLVNGEAVKNIGFKVDPECDKVQIDGSPVKFRKNLYVMLNKPKGALSASTDKNRETVVALVAGKTGRKGLFPVGRLDKDTTGLLIITDDGDFAHKVISPKNHIEKEYLVTLDAPAGEAEKSAFLCGITLADGQVCRPAVMEPVDDTGMVCRMVITEGKYHQIKRMFGRVGIGVNELKRVRIGELALDDRLTEGEFRELNESEIQMVLQEKRRKSV